jgi:transposase
MRDRHRLSKFCLRHGRRLPGKSWDSARRRWLSAQRFAFAAQQQAFDTYVHALDLVDSRIEALERSIRETAEQGAWRGLVARLRCLRGVDTLTALGIAVEIGDFSRFESAEAFIASVGLVPPSTPRASAGAKARSPRSATPTSAACSSRPPGTPAGGRRSATSSPAASAAKKLVERAWRCPQRLSRRWQRMAARGKPSQKIVVACARELAGFVWGSRPSNRSRARERPGSCSASARPHGGPSRPLAAPAAATRDPRPRQLPTVPKHAVPTGECQSDPPSLPRAIRCSTRQVTHPPEPDPLTFCSMSEA